MSPRRLADAMPKEGAEMEGLGTVLAWAGWTLALAATAGWAASFFAWLDTAGFEGFVLWLASGMTVVASLALAGTGHLLRAMAQLGRNVRRLAEMVAQLQRESPR